MRKTSFIILYLVFTSTISFAQIKLPYPINSDRLDFSPALLLDSSIILMSNREDIYKCYRFVFNGDDWVLTPNGLTSQINSILFAKGANCRFSFSDDYTRLVITVNQIDKRKYLESQLINEEWSLFKEILKGKDKSDSFKGVIYSELRYTPDLSKLYVTRHPNKAQNTIYYYRKTDKGWSDRQEITNFQSQFDEISVSIPIGNNGLLFLTPRSEKKSKTKYSGNLFFYTKHITDSEWTAPRIVSELNIKGQIWGLSLIPSKDYFIYDTWFNSDIYLIEVPKFLKGEIIKSHTLLQPNVGTSAVVSNIVSTESKIVKPTGEYYALLIGNSDYELDDLDLDRPVKDVRILFKTLTNFYQFDEKNIITLINSDRDEILQELYNLRKSLNADDNLLIFYAGHGYWDEEIGQGYWWPVDAARDNPSNWLSNSDLREQIKGINSAHTLLISDACFSGGIFKTRGAEEIRKANRDIQLLYRMPSRRAITSGTLSTVPDNSVFFKYFIKYLTENEKKFISSGELFTTIRTSVMNNSLTVPQDGVILNTGDEGGDFIFIKK